MSQCKIMKEAFKVMYEGHLELLGRCSSLDIPRPLIEEIKEAEDKLRNVINLICGEEE